MILKETGILYRNKYLKIDIKFAGSLKILSQLHTVFNIHTYILLKLDSVYVCN